MQAACPTPAQQGLLLVTLKTAYRPIVSAKLRRRRNHSAPPQNQVTNEIGALGHAVVTSLKSAQPPKDKQISGAIHTQTVGPSASNSRLGQRRKNPSRATTVKAIEREKEDEAMQLSGSDVLLALQRASAQRSKNRSVNKTRDPRRRSSSNEDDANDCSNVRPLRIKREWRARLDDFESRLRELKEI